MVLNLRNVNKRELVPQNERDQLLSEKKGWESPTWLFKKLEDNICFVNLYTVTVAWKDPFVCKLAFLDSYHKNRSLEILFLVFLFFYHSSTPFFHSFTSFLCPFLTRNVIKISHFSAPGHRRKFVASPWGYLLTGVFFFSMVRFWGACESLSKW